MNEKQEYRKFCYFILSMEFRCVIWYSNIGE